MSIDNDSDNLLLEIFLPRDLGQAETVYAVVLVCNENLVLEWGFVFPFSSNKAGLKEGFV